MKLFIVPPWVAARIVILYTGGIISRNMMKELTKEAVKYYKTTKKDQ